MINFAINRGDFFIIIQNIMPKRVFVVESFYGPEFKLDTSKLENLLYEYKSTSDISIIYRCSFKSWPKISNLSETSGRTNVI